MFTDEVRSEVWHQVQSRGVRAFLKFLTPDVFAQAARQVGLRIIASPLNLVNLVWLGLSCALDTTKSFTAVLTTTFKILNDAPHSTLARGHHPQPQPTEPNNRSGRRADRARSKHDPRRDDPTQVSEEAFVQARGRMPLGFWIALVMILADRFARQHEAALRWKHFRLLALDGTLLNLPRRAALAKHYGLAKGHRGGRSPQARLVLLQFPTTRVPYRFALGPKSEAEKTAAEPLLESLREDDLLLMDRGFWSYGLFCRIVERRAFFAIRQIAQAHLTPVRTLGPDETLVRYAPTDRKWRKLGLPEAMELRRIAYQVRGFRPSAVITNVTDPAVISYHEWVGMTTAHEAGRVLDETIYHRRWQIETSFSEMKVFQKMKALRGRTPGSIDYEIASHVLLYLLVRWLMVEAALRRGEDPLRLSFVECLREIVDMRQTMMTASWRRVRQVLLSRLLERIASHRVPLRPGRHYPRPKDTKVKDNGHGKKRLPSKMVA
jgi:hypothetical protein